MNLVDTGLVVAAGTYALWCVWPYGWWQRLGVITGLVIVALLAGAIDADDNWE